MWRRFGHPGLNVVNPEMLLLLILEFLNICCVRGQIDVVFEIRILRGLEPSVHSPYKAMTLAQKKSIFIIQE